MDLRLGPSSRVRILPRPEEGLRAVIYLTDQAKYQAPRAEALAARWAAILLIVGLLLHAMFGANGMVIYRQKHAETQALQTDVERLQKENNLYVDQIRSLKSNPAAIEKEAREQLHYTRRGEVVYVAPDPPAKPATDRAKNESKNDR